MLDRIIYISGSGRSGSTVVERLLHSAPSVQALGELHVLWRLSLAEITCSCGKKLPDDTFWNDVLGLAKISAAELRELAALENKICRSKFILKHRFDLQSLRADPDVQRFMGMQFAIFEAVSKLTGARTIVDSSKAGPRAWILATDPRVHLLHLYRHPSDVLTSWRSRKFDKGLGRDMERLPVGTAAIDWMKPEIFSRRLAKQAQVGFMKYEEFVASPRSVLSQAVNSEDSSLLAELAWLDRNAFQPGDNYHSLSGNPDRFGSGPVRIEPRAANGTGLHAVDRVAIRITGGALALAFPYSRPKPKVGN